MSKRKELEQHMNNVKEDLHKLDYGLSESQLENVAKYIACEAKVMPHGLIDHCTIEIFITEKFKFLLEENRIVENKFSKELAEYKRYLIIAGVLEILGAAAIVWFR